MPITQSILQLWFYRLFTARTWAWTISIISCNRWTVLKSRYTKWRPWLNNLFKNCTRDALSMSSLLRSVSKSWAILSPSGKFNSLRKVSPMFLARGSSSCARIPTNQWMYIWTFWGIYLVPISGRLSNPWAIVVLTIRVSVIQRDPIEVPIDQQFPHPRPNI